VSPDVIVRLLAQDDREHEPVLASFYQYRPDGVRKALENLVGLPNVQVEDECAVTNALALSAQGIDFADALHLESRPPGARFASFDQAFVRQARKAGVSEAGLLNSKIF
jgi:hypothetical protein